MHQRLPKRASMQVVAMYKYFHNRTQKYGMRRFHQIYIWAFEKVETSCTAKLFQKPMFQQMLFTCKT
jgi:hypothetical protein